MSTWSGHWLSDLVTDAPDCVTVAEAEEEASEGMYWPISGDDTTIMRGREYGA